MDTSTAMVAVSAASAAAGASGAMSISAWLQLIALGAITGAMGQVVRQIASLKKILDNNPSDRMGETLDQTRIVVNLLIGATAGIIGVLSIGIGTTHIDTKTILALVGFGYAGADFIESFMRRAAPTAAASATKGAAAAPRLQPVPDAKG